MNPKFAPSAAAVSACLAVVNDWKEEHQVESNLEEATHVLASRVNSWVTPQSVSAGVQDVLVGVLPPQFKDAIVQLGDRLGKRLMADGLLVASPRRAASLG